MRTCALNDIPPLPYLTDVLRRLADGWPQKRISDLLPDRWKVSHPEAVRTYRQHEREAKTAAKRERRRRRRALEGANAGGR